jgi:hypothetical protein
VVEPRVHCRLTDRRKFTAFADQDVSVCSEIVERVELAALPLSRCLRGMKAYKTALRLSEVSKFVSLMRTIAICFS